jgi:hypothetical protein
MGENDSPKDGEMEIEPNTIEERKKLMELPDYTLLQRTSLSSGQVFECYATGTWSFAGWRYDLPAARENREIK